MLIQHDKSFDLRNVEQGLRLFPIFDLVGAQQFRASRSDAMTLRFDQPRFAVVDESEPAAVADRIIDVVVQATPPQRTRMKDMLMRSLA